MRVIDRCRHQLLGLVAGVAEHQALVAGALFFRLLAIDTHRDVRRLLADQIQHTAGGAVEADRRRGVADVADDLARQCFEIDPGARSEEHTSELQSLMRSSYAVFCLKKKKSNTRIQ